MVKKYLIKIIPILLLVLMVISCQKRHLIKDNAYRGQVKAMFDKQKDFAKGRFKQLFSVFDGTMTYQEREAMEFLYAFMPLSDLADYNGEYFLSNVRIAIETRNKMPWGKTIPEAEFLYFVLPVRVNNEDLDSFRIKTYNELTERVKGLSMYDAALEINHWCHEKVTYRGSDERTSSPLNSIKNSIGRCGEESTFTVAALRTIGIPARQVYTPRWAHTDDNHAWVEVWVDGKWHFMGACEPEPDLNMGWFAEPSRRTMIMHTRTYGAYNGNEPIIVKQERFSELNLIANYAPSKTFFVKVMGQNNKPIDSAQVRYLLYNYAEFYPIAKGYTDVYGLHNISTGLGDLIVWANKGNDFGFKKISVNNTDTVIINLNNEVKNNQSFDYDMVPPIKLEPKIETANGIENNQKRLKIEDSIRNAYMKTFVDTLEAKKFAYKLSLNTDSVVNVLIKSMGNWNEIKSFLLLAKDRSWALKLLYSITDKDLRDTKANVLNDHLSLGFEYYNIKNSYKQDFYAKYVLSPRISNEFIRPWRAFLLNYFKKGFIVNAQNNVNYIVDWIKTNIKIDNVANLHSRAPLSPKGVAELLVADCHSRDIFFVAVCRTFGIPSRIEQTTSIPQYYNGENWINIYFDPIRKPQGKGFIHFVNDNVTIEPKYATNFTIARFENGIYKTLDFDFDKKLDDFPKEQEVESGNYLLVTGNRLTDGTVLSSISFFEVFKDKTIDLLVHVREKSENRMIIGQILPKDFTITKFNETNKNNLYNIINGKKSVIIWIEPDKEPSKHILADLPLYKETFEKWGVNIIFLLAKDKITKSFNPSNFLNLPKQSSFAYDDDMLLLSAIENIVKQNLKQTFPLIIILDEKGNIWYFSEGYKIGIGEQLNKELSKINQCNINTCGK